MLNHNKLILLIFLILTSCATKVADSDGWINEKIAPTEAKVDSNVKEEYQKRGFFKKYFTSDTIRQTMFYSSQLFEITDSKDGAHSNIEILEIKRMKDHRYNASNGSASILFLLTLGLMPLSNSRELKLDVTYRDLSTQQIHQSIIDFDFTSGIGWFYWLRAWFGEGWKWRAWFSQEERLKQYVSLTCPHLHVHLQLHSL